MHEHTRSAGPQVWDAGDTAPAL